jgi:hypothetical protein
LIMATTRIKFLNRKKILQEDIKIRLERQGKARHFTASLALEAYDFPPDAKVVIEAKTLLQTMRFEIGTAKPSMTVPLKDVSRLESERLTFNVLVLDPSTARKYGAAETVRPVANDDEQSGARALLPVDLADDLDGRIWEVRYTDTDDAGHSDAPVLVFSRLAARDSAAVFAKKPEVRALVMPAAFQVILDRIIFAEEHEYDENGDGWQDKWLQFATSLVGDSMPSGEGDSREDRHQWIRQAACRMAQQAALHDQYMQEIEA